MRHQTQKVFCGIFVGIPHNQKGYFLYVPHTRKIISSYDVVFDEKNSSALAYMSRLYAEAMAVRLSVTYISCAKSSNKQTGDISTFVKFEEGYLLSETCEDA